MFQIKLTGRARKEFKYISQRYLEALTEVFLDLRENPYLGKPLNRELTNKYTYRIGVFRIIYQVNEKDPIVLILTAGHRLTIYK